MKHRALILASGALGALAATRARAQPKAPRIIGWLFPFTKEGQKDVLRDFGADLARLGQVESRDYVIEGRWTGGSVEPLPALAQELVALKPALVVTAGTAAISALQKASSTVPVVFASAGDPIASGFVASLARPGGNIAGVMLRVKAKCGAMIMPQLSLFLNHTTRIGATAFKARLPLFSTWPTFTKGGGLLSYYTPSREILARCAVLADKILRGASPAELPVEQPDRYTLVINMKTAQALGIKVPEPVLIRADEVIR